MGNLVSTKMIRDTKHRGNIMVAVLCILCFCLFTYLYAQWQQNGTLIAAWNDTQYPDEASGELYYTLYDSASGEAIEYMSRRVYKGDELLTGDNQHYRVVKVNGYQAYCELLGESSMVQVLAEMQKEVIETAAFQKNFQSIAIYCTHTDESYVPTSGTESKHGGGDILDVAGVMADTLEEQGVSVVHSDNLHDPHDVNAYQRSRKTAAELLQGAPAVMIDVHRDGIPDPEYYATTLDGKPATQIRIVVGRQNQNSEANIAFAEKMKAYYDEVKPGLIKSIFMAKGNYNQDLAPNSVLLEIGTHTNTLEAAQNGAKEFAQVLPQFLGLKTTGDRNTASEEQVHEGKAAGGIGKAIVVLLVVVLIGVGVYMFISQGKGKV